MRGGETVKGGGEESIVSGADKRHLDREAESMSAWICIMVGRDAKVVAITRS